MKVKENIINILADCRIEENLLFMEGQLDRKTYLEVNKVLQAAGGKWNKSKKAHVFEEDIESVIENIIFTGEITTRQDINFFPTPDNIIDSMLEIAEIQAVDKVLEPSAGNGAIVKRLVKTRCVLIAIEKDLKLFNKIKKFKEDENFLAYWEEHCVIHNTDFLTFNDSDSLYPGFDKIIMNPPFAKQQDIAHVLHAHSLLRENGLLVSVMSLAFTFRTNKASVDFKKFVYENGNITYLPEGSFKSSGTMVNTCLVTLRK